MHLCLNTLKKYFTIPNEMEKADEHRHLPSPASIILGRKLRNMAHPPPDAQNNKKAAPSKRIIR